MAAFEVLSDVALVTSRISRSDTRVESDTPWCLRRAVLALKRSSSAFACKPESCDLQLFFLPASHELPPLAQPARAIVTPRIFCTTARRSWTAIRPIAAKRRALKTPRASTNFRETPRVVFSRNEMICCCAVKARKAQTKHHRAFAGKSKLRLCRQQKREYYQQSVGI